MYDLKAISQSHSSLMGSIIPICLECPLLVTPAIFLFHLQIKTHSGISFKVLCTKNVGFPGALVGKNPLANADDVEHAGSIPGSGRSLGGGHGSPLQYYSLENPMNRGA